MKLCTFVVSSPIGRQQRVGVVTSAGIVDATAARSAFLARQLAPEVAERVASAQVPPEMLGVLAAGHDGVDWIGEAVEYVVASGVPETHGGATTLHRPDAVRLLAPVPRPPGIACFATWRAHIEDSAGKGFALKFPAEGSKVRPYYKGNADSVAGPDDTLERPSYAEELDVECELAAVVGKGGRDLTVEQAQQSIAGYCIFNDVSVRKIQAEEMEMGLGPTKGKDQDGGNVFGPWLVTTDEVGDPLALSMSLHVDGELWSAYETSHMAWGFGDLLSYLSMGQTVHSGHILTSGCFPGGSGLDLGRKLKPGSRVEMRISKLGALFNRIA